MPRPLRGTALRSGGVTIGRHASTQAPPDDSRHEDLTPRSSAHDTLTLVVPPGRSVTVRAAKAVCFHLGAVLLFAVPAVVLWWHVWAGHPANTLTCACGDPAQEV